MNLQNSTIYEILKSAVAAKQKYVTLVSGERIKISLNLRCIATHGTTCVCCGDVGEYWDIIIRKQTDYLIAATLDLYTKNHILLTADHIKPRHHGGSDSLSNLQTMCQKCNGKKGHGYSV